MDAAEVHLNGLLAVIDHSQAFQMSSGADDCTVLQIVRGLKSSTFTGPLGGPGTALTSLNQNDQARPKVWLTTIVEALRLLPYFLIPTKLAGDMPENFDAPEGTEEARMLTDFMDARSKGMNHVAEYILQRCEPRADGATVSSVSKEVNVVNFEAFMIPGRITTSPKVDSKRYLEISWWGLHFAGSLYWSSIMDRSVFGTDVEERLLRQGILHVEAGLRMTQFDIKQPFSLRASLWFWKAFLGAYSLFRASHHGQRIETWARGPRNHLQFCVKTWAQVSTMREWADAKTVLRQVCWPMASPEDHLAESMWNGIVAC
ncbi:hypothetical protein TGAMA5MH_04464 [Trichoderma gamsii]|uniref:Uncharacterized protein n=1 Tax=Trichoderma gamsii TaxID=398673 RepID=A0A2K0TD94_9HYPO|nr:hypothetical protein TGAMA5MH_04464 [Trichoderma gamsii]